VGFFVLFGCENCSWLEIEIGFYSALLRISKSLRFFDTSHLSLYTFLTQPKSILPERGSHGHCFSNFNSRIFCIVVEIYYSLRASLKEHYASTLHRQRIAGVGAYRVFIYCFAKAGGFLNDVKFLDANRIIYFDFVAAGKATGKLYGAHLSG
jgi:hypothetical protein